MKFLTDENVSPVVVSALRNKHHDVWDVKEQGWQEASDERIIRYARRTSRIIISEDLDFGNLKRFPLEDHPGAILLHLHNMHRRNVTIRLLRFLSKTSERNLTGAVILLEEKRFLNIRS